MKKPIFTNKAPAAIGPYSQAVAFENLVFISGQIPLDPVSGELRNESFEAEVHQVINNLEAICIESGGGLDSILKLTIFLTDLENFDHVNAIMEQTFSQPYPARATVEISRLPKNVSIEMDAILAVKS